MSKFNIRPLADRIVVKPIKSGSKTEGGIIIPEALRDREKKGEVVSAGPKVKEVKVGETVLFGTHAGTELEMNNTSYRIMPESEVYAVLND